MAVPASRTGHPLAEAICELTAPPERPMFCRVMPLHALHGPGVVLHMRPRPHVADFEVSSYGGERVVGWRDTSLLHTCVTPNATYIPWLLSGC